MGRGLSSTKFSLPWAWDLLAHALGHVSVLWDLSQACKSLETRQTSTGLEFGFEYSLKYLDCLEDLDILDLKWNVRVIC